MAGTSTVSPFERQSMSQWFIVTTSAEILG
jgi:hypothetical protein